ncbi:hypothetical protein TVAG_037700 [Trichomonas vaginalis G3]|uniref:Uncharacterized protein n=1 Tax=Trichomonas vaginalis (strain ATCC PRA-98 / G3) TaxID=412133 RepID=A2FCX7_TRIV3|nr:hypothetical protein TVAGG3_0417880 [Trichomonas vaginalis G3]EAX97263.1 hypothetical protein TVAG_037700 [Trichomonas vaginalis G3]KAI5535822.1 hypothetical protein TVAGG3_0417880 [Trichomonas vaginalis G3]|eukprot:XP_001310193.1 hypothetical protein [Trichomonas vaginalis G3]
MKTSKSLASGVQLKTMAGKKIQEAHMSMHSKSHTLRTQAKKLETEQKQLTDERLKIDIKLDKVKQQLKQINDQDKQTSIQVQSTASLSTQQQIIEKEKYFNEFLKSILNDLSNPPSTSEPSEFDDLDEEELNAQLAVLDLESTRIVRSESTLQKNEHNDRMSSLVKDMETETIKHETEALELESKASSHICQQYESEATEKILDERLVESHNRAKRAIDALSDIDMRKKSAIFRLEQAKARREQAENTSVNITEREDALAAREADADRTIREMKIPTQEEVETAKFLAQSKTMKFKQLPISPDPVDLVIKQYEIVLNGGEHESISSKLSNQHWRLFKFEEHEKWNKHWEVENKFMNEKMKEFENLPKKETLQRRLDDLKKSIDETKINISKAINEYEILEKPDFTFDQNMLKTKTHYELVDYQKEINNINSELQQLSQRKAVAEYEVERLRSLQQALQLNNEYQESKQD